MESNQKPSLADYFAEERTFLAWIRTGLSLMGFGFVVARFALFLQELQSIERNFVAPARPLSLWFGTALILVGVAVNIYAAIRHAQFVNHLNRGDVTYPLPSKRTSLLALLLALIGLAMAIYLTLIRSSSQPASVQTTSIHSRSIR